MQQNYKFKVVFFAENSGNQPVKEWLQELELDDQRKVGKSALMLQERWPMVSAPLVKSLGNGFFELRINLKNKIARVIFVVQDKDIILLNGFIKKTQKTPINEIEVAVNRLRRHIKGKING